MSSFSAFVSSEFEMTTNCDVVRGGTFAKPTSSYSVMDKEIAFQDDIMLNDETLEATLDRLQEICTAVNSKTFYIAISFFT